MTSLECPVPAMGTAEPELLPLSTAPLRCHYRQRVLALGVSCLTQVHTLLRACWEASQHSSSQKLYTGTSERRRTTLSECNVPGTCERPFLVLLAFLQITRGLQTEGDENQEHDRCHETVRTMKTRK